MIKEELYQQLQYYKSKGLSQRQACARLKMSQNTARKYWNLSPEDFHALQKQESNRLLIGEQYRDDILYCLKYYPEMSTRMISEHICMKKGIDSLGVADRTFQALVARLRKEHNIPKQTPIAPIHEPDFQERGSVLKRLAEKKAQVQPAKSSPAIGKEKSKKWPSL